MTGPAGRSRIRFRVRTRAEVGDDASGALLRRLMRGVDLEVVFDTDVDERHLISRHPDDAVAAGPLALGQDCQVAVDANPERLDATQRDTPSGLRDGTLHPDIVDDDAGTGPRHRGDTLRPGILQAGELLAHPDPSVGLERDTGHSVHDPRWHREDQVVDLHRQPGISELVLQRLGNARLARR